MCGSETDCGGTILGVLSEKCSGTYGPLNAWGCGLTGG